MNVEDPSGSEPSVPAASGAEDAAALPSISRVGRTVYAVERGPGERPSAFSERERDFVLLTLFVLVQHRQYDKAAIIAEGLLRAGGASREVLLAHAVIAFCRQDYDTTLRSLARLDRINPIERYGSRKSTERERMRSYLRARSLHELGDGKRNAIDLYLRHARGQGEDQR